MRKGNRPVGRAPPKGRTGHFTVSINADYNPFLPRDVVDLSQIQFRGVAARLRSPAFSKSRAFVPAKTE